MSSFIDICTYRNSMRKYCLTVFSFHISFSLIFFVYFLDYLSCAALIFLFPKNLLCWYCSIKCRVCKLKLNFFFFIFFFFQFVIFYYFITFFKITLNWKFFQRSNMSDAIAVTISFYCKAGVERTLLPEWMLYGHIHLCWENAILVRSAGLSTVLTYCSSTGLRFSSRNFLSIFYFQQKARSTVSITVVSNVVLRVS